MTKKRNQPWKLLGFMAGGAVVMFAVGFLIATRILFPPLPAPENGIVVPSVTGLTVEQAQERLRALGLRLTETMSVPNAQVPGVIIAQSPLAGQQLREMGTVRVGIAAPLPAPVPADTPVPIPVPVPVPDTVSVQDTVSLFR